MTGPGADLGGIPVFPGDMDDQERSTGEEPTRRQPRQASSPVPEQTRDPSARAEVPGEVTGQLPASERSGGERYHLGHNPNSSRRYADFVVD
ncbi:hypothetical protein NDU88_009879 [Pleurodeles waltl]|uniref:Uncharacterized protein n=1 Tax=Pleurodeles waltl TaxID=8319 RepID=A0AAV7PTJ5_PLEWA|nr:hypothetical protein NDU88_009879 [Pleurodeles waltl]